MPPPPVYLKLESTKASPKKRVSKSKFDGKFRLNCREREMETWKKKKENTDLKYVNVRAVELK